MFSRAVPENITKEAGDTLEIMCADPGIPPKKIEVFLNYFEFSIKWGNDVFQTFICVLGHLYRMDGYNLTVITATCTFDEENVKSNWLW